ncbi:MAG: flagellar protein FliJ [Solirubrobacteraceae bacterium]
MTGPSFAFSLERVREVRAHEEDVAREAFAASLSVRARGVALLADAQQRAADAREQAVTETAPRSGADLIAAQAWLERVQRSQEHAALELDRHDADVESHRAALTTAGQRRQALERLKARQREAHRVKSARREAGILDEIALNGHIRRAS